MITFTRIHFMRTAVLTAVVILLLAVGPPSGYAAGATGGGPCYWCPAVNSPTVTVTWYPNGYSQYDPGWVHIVYQNFLPNTVHTVDYSSGYARNTVPEYQITTNAQGRYEEWRTDTCSRWYPIIVTVFALHGYDYAFGATLPYPCVQLW